MNVIHRNPRNVNSVWLQPALPTRIDQRLEQPPTIEAASVFTDDLRPQSLIADQTKPNRGVDCVLCLSLGEPEARGFEDESLGSQHPQPLYTHHVATVQRGRCAPNNTLGRSISKLPFQQQFDVVSGETIEPQKPRPRPASNHSDATKIERSSSE